MKLIVLIVIASVLMAGCNLNAPPQPPASLTAAPLVSPSPFPSATSSPLPSPSHTATASPTPSTPSATPSPSATPTATSPFFEHLVAEDETLFYILQLPEYGYDYEPQVAELVVALNPALDSADDLSPGQTILIPRPTPSSTAVGARATAAVLATIGFDDLAGAVLPVGALVGCHTVKANDSLIGIAIEFDTTLEILSALNTEINWYGCNFTEPSGGPECNPTLRIAQCVHVPLPTPLPTKVPTPTGFETATPTPTKLAPRLLYPRVGEFVSQASITFQWLGLPAMQDGDQYLVEIIDQTTNERFNLTTSATAINFAPASESGTGQAHKMQWRVLVARRNAAGAYVYVGAQGDWQFFEWQR